MRNNWYRNEGPRGRRFGRSRRYRNSTGGGLIGLLVLLIGLPVMLPLLGAAIISAGALVGGLAAGFVGILHAFRAVFAGLVSASFTSFSMIGGVVMGVLIGLIAYRMIRTRKEARAAEEAADRNDDLSSCGTYEEGNDLTEPQSYRSFNA